MRSPSNCGKVGTRKWVSSPQGIVLWKMHGSFQNKMELVASNETLWHLRTGLHRADRHWLGMVWEGGGGGGHGVEGGGEGSEGCEVVVSVDRSRQGRVAWTNIFRHYAR
jgi:hypothetical protein